MTEPNPELTALLEQIAEPDYVTDSFSDIGIPSHLIQKDVFRADNSYLGGYLAKALHSNPDLVKSRTVLDMGCGSGLLGLVSAVNGARSVHFSDVVPEL